MANRNGLYYQSCLEFYRQYGICVDSKERLADTAWISGNDRVQLPEIRFFDEYAQQRFLKRTIMIPGFMPMNRICSIIFHCRPFMARGYIII